MSYLDIPSLNEDPVFIAIGDSFEAIRQRRLDVLRREYRILGHNELGGDIRPELNLCNMPSSKMFDGKEPEVGDIVCIGHLYGPDSARVLICRLALRHADWRERPHCPRLGRGYTYEWQVEPLAWHRFSPEDGGRDYHPVAAAEHAS